MSRFIYPVNAPLSQGFGENPAYYKQFGQLGHNGQDFACALNTPIKAAADGTVYFEGYGQNNAWMGSPAGICVILDHGDMYTGYAHLTSTTVNEGQSVTQGQIIGYSGQTGAATGPHLHFEFIGRPPQINNGYYGRINPVFEDLGKGADMETVNKGDLVNYFRVILGREPDDGAYSTFVGMSHKAVIYALFQSPEYAARQSILQAKDATIAQLQQSVSDLSSRPTKDELQQALEKSAQELNTIQELQAQLEVAKNTPPVVVEKVVEKPSRWSWLTELLDALFKKKDNK